MKLLIAAITLVTLVGTAAAAASAAGAPSAEQQAAIDQAPSFSGKIIRATFVHGFGWQSHTDLLMPVAADDKKEMFFYLRESSFITDASGIYVRLADLPHRMRGQRVEIRYAVITDATGNVEKIENGKDGILLIRFLDWTAGGK